MSGTDEGGLPEACGVAFKEWAGVCAALASGRQSVILRKGGIAEGRGGFRPEHAAFWLYPTHVHQAEQGLKPEAREAGDDTPSDPQAVSIRSLAVVNWLGRVESLEALRPLDPWHVWTAETVEKRFHYREPGLWVLGVRVYSRPEPFRLEVTPGQIGCKSWVPLDPPLPTTGLSAVVGSEDFARRLDRLRALPVGRGPC